jgi:hypothetical protein
MAETHLANCDRCQALVKVLVREAPGVEAPQTVRRPWLRWVLPLAAAATAVAVWVAVPGTPTSDIATSSEREQAVASPKSSQPNLTKETPSTSPDTNVAQRDASEARRMSEVTSAKPAAPKPATQLEQTTQSSPAPSRENQATRDRMDESKSDVAKLEADRVEPQMRTAEKAAAPAATAAAAPASPAPPPLPAPVAPAQKAGSAAISTLASSTSETIVMSPQSSYRWRISGRVVDYSSDGGANWQIVLPDAATTLSAGSAPSSATCWVVGHGGTVWRSLDGRRFIRVPFPDSADLAAVRATDGFNAVATTVDGREFATTNGGATWTRR